MSNNTNTAGEALDLNKTRAEFEAWWRDAASKIDFSKPITEFAHEVWSAALARAGSAAPTELSGKAVVEMLRRTMDQAGIKGEARGLLVGFFGNEWNKAQGASAHPSIDRAKFDAFCEDMIDGTDTVDRVWLLDFVQRWVRTDLAAPTGQQAEPVAWVRFRSDGGYEGPIMDFAIEEVRKKSGVWTPLYAAMSAAQAQPKDTTDTKEKA